MASIGQAADAKRETQVGEQMNRLFGLIDDIGMCVEGLESRLTSVLRSEPVPAGTKEASVAPMIVPLAESLRCQTDRLNNIYRHLETIKNRIEV